MLDPTYERVVAASFKQWKDALDALVKAKDHSDTSRDEIARLQREADVLLEKAEQALRNRATPEGRSSLPKAKP